MINTCIKCGKTITGVSIFDGSSYYHPHCFTEKEEGRFYCNWCGEMKPIDERREITDKTEYVTWLGCVNCATKQKQI